MVTLVVTFGWLRREVNLRCRHEDALQKANRSLETALARAREADRLKSAFLAVMSHELRTPLNSILGFTGVLLKELPGPLNEEQRKQLTIVRDNARHLLDLINDVLDLSKIEAGQMKVASAPYSVREVVTRAVEAVRPRVESKGLAMELALHPAVDRAVGDARRVEQILLNFLANAVRFTEQGRIRVWVDLVESARELRFRVEDKGCGIAAENLERIFQPFEQLQTGPGRPHEGTGLGLAICRRLADLLGGRIEVHSQPGQGSVFTLLLPVEPRGDPGASEARSTGPGS
ncbi:hypothetical protein G4L39_05795 [Limisphaera ngatamarikiensis]|uniref:histidine kinase n=2 Tax=Limisphaera ngatamarikiensis TaxID=1324935 RepID=A0A6M1RFU4_9BACT|nr:hypothetical protein [Limisphaera ngatamarikiensis]